MKLNRKLMSVAVAGALAAPALAYAQASTVQLFGRLNFLYGYYDNGDAGRATATPTSVAGVGKVNNDAMADSESEIGVRGEENVGGGLTVHFQCLTSFDVVGIRAAAGTAGWCGRNSNIGLKGGFGNVFIGNYDTAAKIMMANYRVFALNFPMGLGNTFNGSASNVDNGALLNPPVFAADLASFSRRQEKSLHYWSPSFSGFQVMGTVSATNESTLTNDASTISKPRMWSTSLNYKNGPFGVGVGYERHQDYNAGAQANYTGGDDNSWQIGIGYKFMGKLQINAMWVRMDYDLAAGASTRQTNWNINGQWDIAGPHFIRFGYQNIGDSKGSAGTLAAPIQVGQFRANGGAGDTGSDKIVFEYGYNLSKRTELTLGYARVHNDRYAAYSVGGNSDNPNFGETQTYIGGRISHRF